jgi:hypothetical protein
VHTEVWWENVRQTDHLEDLDVDEKIILKWIFKKSKGAWNGLIWLRLGEVAGPCECGNDVSCSIHCEEFIN